MRRTGRTTRLLADAAKHAAAGHYVFAVGADAQHAKLLYQQFLREHGGDGGGEDKLYHKGGSVSFESGERLNWDLLRFPGAHPDCVILIDHHAIERRYSRILEMLHRYDATTG